MSDRSDFLTASRAVVTPMEAYAFWLAIYMKNGGTIKKSDHNYISRAQVINGDNIVGFDISGGGKVDYNSKAYTDISWSRWTPTCDGGLIPSGYGSSALELFLMPSITGQKVVSSSGDSRKGWEFGHTEVQILDKDADGCWVAQTNKRSATMYADVAKYLQGLSMQELEGNLRAVAGVVSQDALAV